MPTRRKHDEQSLYEFIEGFSWVATNLKRYFSPSGVSASSGRPRKRLKTTPTSFAPSSKSDSPPVFRVSNSPFSRLRAHSPFNARTPNCTPMMAPPIDHPPDRHKKWQNHLAQLTACVTDSYTKNPDWDHRFWDAIAYPSVVYLIPFLQTLRIYDFEVKEMANDICIMTFDISFGFNDSRKMPALNLDNYWGIVTKLKEILGGDERFRIQAKYCSNINYDRSTHQDKRQNLFFQREWTHESDSFASTVELATHLHTLTPELPFKWSDVLRIWLRFAHKKIYDEEIEKDMEVTEPVKLEEHDTDYEPSTIDEDSDDDDEDEEIIPADILKHIQQDYYAYKEKMKQEARKKAENSV